MNHEMSKNDPKMKACIDSCRSCEDACSSSVPHCVDLGGRHATSAHITLLLDCARICATASDFMVRGSEHHTQVCGICADVCDACAKACEQFGDDSIMRQVAHACRQCSKSCHEMSAAVTK